MTPEEIKSKLGQMLLVDFLAAHPESAPVLFNHFGAACFTCPGRFDETLDLAIRVHETDEDAFYLDLSAVLV